MHKGNHYISLSRVQKALGEMASSAQASLRFKLEYRIDPNETEKTEEIRDSLLLSPVLPESINMTDGLIPDHYLRKVMARNRYMNHSRGHKLNVQRDRKKSSSRRAGGGFSFKPEIPYLPRVHGGHEISLNGSSEYEEFHRPRYARKNHPQQSMPKIEWPVVRGWYSHKPINTTEEALRLKRKEEDTRLRVISSTTNPFRPKRSYLR